jgi:hypothetical protein
VRAFLAEIRRRDPVLSTTGWVHLALAGVFLVALTLDDRTILGLDPWVKPLKFALSITVYVWTVAWFLEDVRRAAPRAAKMISGGVAVTMFTEIACIALQSLRGVPSHFNAATAFNGVVFSLMGLMIFANSLLAAALCVLYFTVPLGKQPQPGVWAVRLGLLLFLVGSGVGGLMVSRSAHAVGVPDGGPGLPFVNWSTEGGDLRAAHALGLHALQILPLAAWALRRVRGLSEARQTATVFGLAACYLLLSTLVLGQALFGRPLLRARWGHMSTMVVPSA